MIFSLLVPSSVIAVSRGEADSETDLSAEKNFLRFKKEINHALPGQSFFRINFDQPHPDHGKGGVLRPIGREVVHTTLATSSQKFQMNAFDDAAEVFVAILENIHKIFYEFERAGTVLKLQNKK